MQIATTDNGKWRIIQLVGRLDAQTSSLVEDNLKAELDAGNKFFAIDLSETSYISSAGLRVFLLILKTVKSRSGLMLLLKPRANVLDVLEMSGFARIFMVADSIEGLL